jgi:ferrochelatase
VKAVMLMAYGTPKGIADVEQYFTNIRGGRPPKPAELATLVARYQAIGGTSPLVTITEAERSKLQARLTASGSTTKVYSAMKHASPFIADVVGQAAADGATQLLAIALAPHYSKMSVGAYDLAVELANSALPSRMALDLVNSWHTNPILIRAWVDRVRKASAGLDDGYSLIFTAHSLPERILAQGDPYRSQLLETSDLVAKQLGKEGWTFAFQSAGHTGEPWLGPDILDHLQGLADRGARDFLIAQIGFVSDHLEILYDIDVECKDWAKEHGARLVRCESLNDSDELISCLESMVAERGFR